MGRAKVMSTDEKHRKQRKLTALLRQDEDYREREKEKNRESIRKKRDEESYRIAEREKNKLRMQNLRKRQDFREREREQNKIRTRKVRKRKLITNSGKRRPPKLHANHNDKGQVKTTEVGNK